MITTFVTDAMIILHTTNAIISPKLKRIIPIFLVKNVNFIQKEAHPISTNKLKNSFKDFIDLVSRIVLINSNAVNPKINVAKK